VEKIEQLSKDEFAKQAATIYINAFLGIITLLDKHKIIDESFEDDITQLYEESAKKMIQYGKALEKKDEETRQEFIMASGLTGWAMIDEIDPKEKEAFEKQLDDREPEFAAYQSLTLKRKFNNLFQILNFLNFEELKEENPESAKEFGIE